MSVKKENNDAGIQSENFPNFDVPINNPITTNTIGVTEEAIISRDFNMIEGILICRLPKSIPKITASKSGFFMKFLRVLIIMFDLFLFNE